jgi:hypothetical protein
MEGCEACLAHSNVMIHVPLHGVTHDDVARHGKDFSARVITRQGVTEEAKNGVKLNPVLSIIKKHVSWGR